jgi:hypothetical protein
MSISGVSPFSPVHANDPRAEFQRLRELHAKGPQGYESRRRDEETEVRPTAAASALADAAPTPGGSARQGSGAIPGRLDIIV